MLPVAPMPYTDLINVQVVRTFGMVEWALPPTARNVYVYMHPFGRASPSVINRLIKAGSLLSPTSSSGDIRAIPSVTQAATPMRPSAPWWTRTTDVSKSRFYRPLQSPLCTTRQKSKPRESNPTTKRLCQQDCKSAPKKQMAQPYRRHRMGPAQETRMDAISRTIQKHTLYSGIHPPSKGPQPDSNRQLTTHRQESQKPMRD